MHDNKDTENFLQVLSSTPISPETQTEYIAYHEDVDSGEISDQIIHSAEEKLFDGQVPVPEKKSILYALGHSAVTSSYQILHRFIEEGDPALKKWAILAFKECALGLSNDLFDEDAVAVITGLGEAGGRLRYCMILHLHDSTAFSEEDADLFKESATVIKEKYLSEFEEMRVERNYLLVTMLVPADVGAGIVIGEIIFECNKQKKLLCPDYFVTNTKKPTEDEILQFLTSHR